MAETINPPTVVVADDENEYHVLSNAGSVIVRNRSGTKAANINIGYTDLGGSNEEPELDGTYAFHLIPGDSIDLIVRGTSTRLNYISAGTGETVTLEIIEIKD